MTLGKMINAAETSKTAFFSKANFVMTLSTQIIVALGANLASAERGPLINLKHSINVLECDTIQITNTSRWYQSPAFPAGSGPDYVNGALIAQSTLCANDVLARLHEVEQSHGRKRSDRWGPRACDLDLIAFGDAIAPDLGTYNKWRNLPLNQQQQQTPKELILPHPRLQDRAFVLLPMRDIAPDWVHPVSKQSISAMINALPQSDIKALKPLSDDDAD